MEPRWAGESLYVRELLSGLLVLRHDWSEPKLLGGSAGLAFSVLGSEPMPMDQIATMVIARFGLTVDDYTNFLATLAEALQMLVAEGVATLHER